MSENELKGCQCLSCQFIKHDSDCAVHNMPAHPNEPCNCSKLNTKQQSSELADNLQSLAKSTNSQFLAQVAYRLRTQAAKIEALTQELETERMRLVACGVAAMGNTKTSKLERINKDNPYWSASYGDVCRAVDAEIELRGKIEALEKDAKRYQFWRQRFFALGTED